MQKYRVTSPMGLEFRAGAVLALSAAVAGVLAGKLKKVEGQEGVFETTGPVTLKKGFEFGYAGALPKSIVDQVEDPDKPKELQLPAPPSGKGKGKGK